MLKCKVFQAYSAAAVKPSRVLRPAQLRLLHIPLRASSPSWRLPMREWQHAMLYRAACFSPLLIAGGLSLHIDALAIKLIHHA